MPSVIDLERLAEHIEAESKKLVDEVRINNLRATVSSVLNELRNNGKFSVLSNAANKASKAVGNNPRFDVIVLFPPENTYLGPFKIWTENEIKYYIDHVKHILPVVLIPYESFWYTRDSLAELHVMEYLSDDVMRPPVVAENYRLRSKVLMPNPHVILGHAIIERGLLSFKLVASADKVKKLMMDFIVNESRRFDEISDEEIYRITFKKAMLYEGVRARLLKMSTEIYRKISEMGITRLTSADPQFEEVMGMLHQLQLAGEPTLWYAPVVYAINGGFVNDRLKRIVNRARDEARRILSRKFGREFFPS